MWTMNFQMFKLDLEKAEEPEIKLPTSAGSWKKEFQKNIYFCFIDYAKAFDCVDHKKLKNSERDWNTRPPDLTLEKPIWRSEATVRPGHGTRDWFQIGKGVCHGCILSPMLVRACLKSCTLGFSILWTKNFQVSKLGLEKAEEPEFKLSTLGGSWRKQGSSRKTSTLLNCLC